MNTIDLSKKNEFLKLRLVKDQNITQKKELENCFKKFSKKNFIIEENGKEITYKDFFINSLKLVYYLKKKGLEKNSKILILSDNCLNYLITLTACLLGGFIVCPIDPTMKTERLEELKKILKFDFIIKNANKLIFKNCPVDPDLINYRNEDFLIICSSGTTGDPKGILFSSDAFLKSSKSFSNLTKYSEQTKILHCLPMFYMAGILNTFFSCMFAGSKIVLGKKFSVSSILNFWNLPKKFDCNFLHLTPSIYASICAVFKKNSKLNEHTKKYKSIISTGSFLYPEIQEKFYKIFNKRIFSCYGVTEIGGPLTIQSSKDVSLNFCVGTHSPEVKININKDPNGDKKVFIKSPFLIKGYLTKAGLEIPKTKDGYYDTGDIGDYKNNLLFINGRKKDFIKRGGELISLSLIENTALQNDSILEAAAIGKKDVLVGEELYLIITINGKFSLNEKINEIRSFLSNKLRPIEMLKKITIIPEMPKTGSGKIKKDSLIKII